jgi:hypothetical protein
MATSKFRGEMIMPLVEAIIGFWAVHRLLGIGFVLLIVALVLGFRRANLTAMQAYLVRTTAAIGCACIMAEVPGLLNVTLDPTPNVAISAAGALAVFALIFFFAPPGAH